MKIEVTAGDTKPLSGNYTSDGVAVDLTGYTVAIVIGYAPTPLVKPGTILNQVTNRGQFEFPWVSEDLIAGTYSAQIRITDPSAHLENTDQFIIEIGASL